MKSIQLKTLLQLFYISVGSIIIYLILKLIININDSHQTTERFSNNSNNSICNSIWGNNSQLVTFNKMDIGDMNYIINYIPSNSQKCINIKCGFPSVYKGNQYSQYYKSHQKSFTIEEQNKCQELIKRIMGKHVFGQNASLEFMFPFESQCKWNLIKTNILEMNLPCTLSKCILIPADILNSSMNSNNDSHLENILMHEQMHILQRQNQDVFNREYKRIFGKYIIPIDKSKIDFSALDLQNIMITNPDEDSLEWIIKDGNNHYVVPYLVPINYNNDSRQINSIPLVTTNTAYQIDMNSLVVTGNSVPIENLEYCSYLKSISNGKQLNIAHPNETYTDLFLHAF